MVFSRNLLPSAAVLDQWTTVAHGRAWAGVDDVNWAIVAGLLGDMTLDHIVFFAAMPPAIVRAAVESFTPAQLTALDRTKLSMLYNACRAKFDMELEDIAAPAPVAAQGPATAVAAPVAATGSIGVVKIRLCQVTDQGSDVEGFGAVEGGDQGEAEALCQLLWRCATGRGRDHRHSAVGICQEH